MAEHNEALGVLGTTVFKWALGAAWGCIVAAFSWIWVTDRAVRKLIQDQAAYREAREKSEELDREERRAWREEMKESIERLGERVGPLELDKAFRQGADAARHEMQRES